MFHYTSQHHQLIHEPLPKQLSNYVSQSYQMQLPQPDDLGGDSFPVASMHSRLQGKP
uniref:Acetylglucosaminyltransferase/ transferase, transferring glycosyl groups n=1 Tax=Arundo donax TaxID=35708 RepID=A0A0A9GUF0_ARUDO